MEAKARQRVLSKLTELHESEYRNRDRKAQNDLNRLLGFMDKVLKNVREEELTDPEQAHEIMVMRNLLGPALKNIKRGYSARFPLADGAGGTIDMVVKFE